MNFQKDKELDISELHELKIQSNKSICRAFSYNSVIPSALSTTICVAMQNPNSVQDLKAATFRAFSRNMYSRFHGVDDEPSKPTDEEIKKAKEKYSILVRTYGHAIFTLFSHRWAIAQGEYQEVDEHGQPTDDDAQEECGKASRMIGKAVNYARKLHTVHHADNREKGEYIGMLNERVKNEPMSAMVPLKFDAKLDGIAGIVIGNIFVLENSRLPEMYKNNNVGFIVMGETQNVTAGGDWTTDINGQMVMLQTSGAEKQMDLTNNNFSFATKILRDEYKESGYSFEDISGLKIIEGDDDGYGDRSDSPNYTPNADRLREVMNELGITESKNNLSKAGDITQEFAFAMIHIFRTLKTIFPDMPINVNAGNNSKNRKAYSKHLQGSGIDIGIGLDGSKKFSSAYLDPATNKKIDPHNGGKALDDDGNIARKTGKPAYGAWATSAGRKRLSDVAEVLGQYVSGNRNLDGKPMFCFGDEYQYPTAHATGGHFHLSTFFKSNGDFASDSKKWIKKYADKGRVIYTEGHGLLYKNNHMLKHNYHYDPKGGPAGTKTLTTGYIGRNEEIFGAATFYDVTEDYSINPS